MADIGAPTLRVLKTFVASVDKDPDLLHKSELSFFKDYLTKMGAKIPEAKKAHAHEHGHAEHGHAEHGHEHDGCCGHEKKAGCCGEDHGHGHDHGHA